MSSKVLLKFYLGAFFLALFLISCLSAQDLEVCQSDESILCNNECANKDGTWLCVNNPKTNVTSCLCKKYKIWNNFPCSNYSCTPKDCNAKLNTTTIIVALDYSDICYCYHEPAAKTEPYEDSVLAYRKRMSQLFAQTQSSSDSRSKTIIEKLIEKYA
jgi:hypothetical protein